MVYMPLDEQGMHVEYHGLLGHDGVSRLAGYTH